MPDARVVVKGSAWRSYFIRHPWSETLAKRCVWQPLNPISRMSILHLLLTTVEAPKKKNTIEWKQNSIWEYLYRNLPFVPKRNCLCFLSPASSFIEPIFVAQQTFPKTAALISVTEISWDQTQCTKTGFMCVWNKNKSVFLKELKYIWEKYENYSASNTLLISDPEKALLNPPYTAIFPKRHDFDDEDDDFLGPYGKFWAFLVGLVHAEDVQSYVKEHPFGEPAMSPSHPEKKLLIITKEMNEEPLAKYEELKEKIWTEHKEIETKKTTNLNEKEIKAEHEEMEAKTYLPHLDI
ncbi:hypothetical protein LXL04_011185 [Taraxacum kok-saghyz]